MTSTAGTRLAVLGSPIAHSLSPALHAAAYRVLGLPWTYETAEVTAATLEGFVESCGPEWRGLSLTMPLKRDVLPLLDSVDDVALLTGVANTLRFDGGKRYGYNTDVSGIIEPFRQRGITRLNDVVVLGGGATAASALVAVSRLGAQRVVVAVRSPGKAGAITALGERLGVTAEIRDITQLSPGKPDAIISTIPNGADAAARFPESVRRHTVLFDVAYDPWPSPLAVSWMEADGQVIPGIEMLICQALVQVRIFVTGNPETALPDEAAVLAAMRGSVAAH